MQDKKNQSMWDMIGIRDMISLLPLQGMIMRKSPVNNKEASALFRIWNSDKDPYGKFEIPSDIDAHVVANLGTKGLIKNDFRLHTNYCDITNKGREIIKHIILHGESSSFNKTKEACSVNYEKIYNKMNNPHSKESQKVASRKPSGRKNWLQRMK